MKPRLLGHFGTTPGLNFVYAHLNRAIKARDLSAIYITGPGHGGPGLVANAYLEGTYAELYPQISEDEAGLRELFRQFSFPGGIPSHVAPETPGSIHEGGELGYALSHAFGAAFDNPDLLVACVVGDGEAETGPLATSWHSNKFLNAATRRRRPADPASERLQDRQPDGARPDPGARAARAVRRLRLAAADRHVASSTNRRQTRTSGSRRRSTRRSTTSARSRTRPADGATERPRWPMLILRTPKGWTGPREVDGVQIEGTWRAHQVPVLAVRENAKHRKVLEDWLRSYRAEELFDDDGRLRPELRALAPSGERRMSANPHANGGVLLRDLVLPDFRDYAVEVEQPGTVDVGGDAGARAVPARRDRARTRTTSGCSAPTRRSRTASATSSR